MKTKSKNKKTLEQRINELEQRIVLLESKKIVLVYPHCHLPDYPQMNRTLQPSSIWPPQTTC